MTFNKFAAGRKVYGQGATSPTRGTVDPSGYIKRELARRSMQHGVSRQGSDGQSDTRSGIAHTAIKNNIANNAGRPQQNRSSGPRQPQGGFAGNLPSYMAGQGNRNQQGNNSTAPVGSPSAGPVGAAPQSVQVNANGVLELPYNSEYANQVLDAQGNFDSEMLNLNYEDQQQDQEYAQFIRQLEQGYTDRQRDTLGNSAGRGMLYSSQYTTGANNDARDYNNSKNDAAAQDTIFNNNITARRNAAQTMLNQIIQRATQGYADSLAANAGSLGFGASGDPGAGAPTPGAASYMPGALWLGNNVPRPEASSLPKHKPPKGVKSVNSGLGDNKPPKKKGKK